MLDYMKANVEGDLDTFLEGFGLTQETVDEFMTITLNEDGTYTSSNVHLEEPSEGTWRLDGDKVIITGNNGNETELTYEDGCLLSEQENGEVWKFAK